MSLEFTDGKEVISIPESLIYTASRKAVSGDTQALQPEEIKALAGKVSSVAQARKRTLMRAGTSIAIYSVIVTLAALLMEALPMAHAWRWGFPILYGILMFGVMLGAIYLRMGRRNRKLQKEVEQLAAQDSPLVIGPMIDLLSMDDRPMAKTARHALTRLAGQWNEDDVAALTPLQRKQLRQMARGIRSTQQADNTMSHAYWQGRVAFRVALCHVLGRCGDSKDLSALRQLAFLPAVTPWARQVKQAAREAIPILEARLAEKNRPHTLLRASNAPVAAPAELLRPASGSAPAPGGELLRAAVYEESLRSRRHGGE